MDPLKIHTRVDEETGEIWVCTGSVGSENWEALFPLKQIMTIMEGGNRAVVSDTGALRVEMSTPSTENFIIRSQEFNLAKNGTRDIIKAYGTDHEIWVYGLVASTDTTGTVAFLDSGGQVLSGTMGLISTGTNALTFPISPNLSMPWFKCLPNTKFQATLSANSDLDGVVVFAIVKV